MGVFIELHFLVSQEPFLDGENRAAQVRSLRNNMEPLYTVACDR